MTERNPINLCAACGRPWPCGTVFYGDEPVAVPASLLSRLLGFVEAGPHAEVVEDVDAANALLRPFLRPCEPIPA